MPMAGGLYFEEHGRADGPPLILSAGLGGSGQYWAPNIPSLAEHFRVVTYDHRGTGRSDRTLPETVTVDQMADDLLNVIDALGVESAAVMGHAAGEVASLAASLKAPARIAFQVLVNAWSKPDPHFARCFDARLALLRHAGPRAYLAAQPIFLFPATWISEHSAVLDAELIGQVEQFAGVETYEKRIAALSAFDVDARLGDVTVPTVALAAADDMLVPSTCSERLADGIPGAELAMMRWGGHGCNVTAAESFNQLVLEITLGD
ncbi:pyrimidine utilization protein D [Sphingobium boeckii]|uniref:Putative carbamate hydrolase RutD n=1 Tax=Sphingobium boeckii TaxID=1082345 RepID=A0A7W9EF00_9SPHN|nr:pyrimidine utilization protein D [Sphingobium boeckii]MBB5685565.1 aminoacrylate hydrolase [Sphingobium boeckii]